MAQIGELSIGIRLTGLSQATTGLNDFRKNIGQITKDLGQLQRGLREVGLITTGAFAAAFKVASKESSLVNDELKKLSEATTEISKTMAKAALPVLEDFGKLLNGVSNSIQKVNPAILEWGLRIGAAALALEIILARGKAFLILIRGLLSPIGLAIIAIGALAAGIYLLARNIAFTRPFILEFEEWLKSIFENQLNKSMNALDHFKEGFLSAFKEMKEGARQFGLQVAQSLENAFSDTLFNAITGRLKGLRSVAISLGEDILKQGLKFGTNQLFGALFKGFGKLFGKKDPMSDLQEKTQVVSDKFAALAINMDKFAMAKDRAIAALNRGSQGGALAGPAGFAGGAISAIPEKAIQAAGVFSEITEKIKGSFVSINSNIGLIGVNFAKSMKESVIAFGIAQAVMVGISAVSHALMVAIGTVAASALFSAWLPTAIVASIATLGGAAAIGSASVVGALGKGLGGLFAPKGGGDLPAGAGISGDLNAPFSGGEIKGLAEGGIVRKPTFAMIGEAGPEAVVPLNEAGGIGTNVIIQSDVIFADDPSSVDRLVRNIKEGLLRASNRRTGGTSIAF